MGAFFKLNLFGRVALAAGMTCATVSAGDKYLAVNGPLPLRFQAVVPQYDPATVLPPLQMSDRLETNVVEALPKTVAQPVAQLPAEPAAEAEVTLPHAQTEPVAPPPVNPPETKPESSQLTPQMLLRYFRDDPKKEVVVPAGVEFTPPTPVTAPGRSSAVYTSPPAK